MRATLEFTLPEQDEEFRNALDGTRYRTHLQAVASRVRAILKYDSPTKSAEKVLEEIRQLVYSVEDLPID